MRPVYVFAALALLGVAAALPVPVVRQQEPNPVIPLAFASQSISSVPMPPSASPVAPSSSPVAPSASLVAPSASPVAPSMSSMATMVPTMSAPAASVGPMALTPVLAVLPSASMMTAMVPTMSATVPSMNPMAAMVPTMGATVPSVNPMTAIVPTMSAMAHMSPMATMVPTMSATAPMNPMAAMVPDMGATEPSMNPMTAMVPTMSATAPMIPMATMVPTMSAMAPMMVPTMSATAPSMNPMTAMVPTMSAMAPMSPMANMVPTMSATAPMNPMTAMVPDMGATEPSMNPMTAMVPTMSAMAPMIPMATIVPTMSATVPSVSPMALPLGLAVLPSAELSTPQLPESSMAILPIDPTITGTQISFPLTATTTPSVESLQPMPSASPVFKVTVESSVEPSSPAIVPVITAVQTSVPLNEETRGIEVQSTPTPTPVCFPGSASVMLSSGATKSMADLAVGDEVAVGAGKFSKVFMFTHRLTSVVHSFVKLSVAGGHSLTLTHGHYLYVNGDLRTAATAKVGDAVILMDGSTAAIETVAAVQDVGLYNPQTVHGDIIVDGVRASTYTSAVAPGFAHAALAPLRALFNKLNIATSGFERGADTLAQCVPKGVQVM